MLDADLEPDRRLPSGRFSSESRGCGAPSAISPGVEDACLDRAAIGQQAVGDVELVDALEARRQRRLARPLELGNDVPQRHWAAILR